MAAESSKLARLESGVPGLDLILDGGFFETGVYVVEGDPGAGKTILANQIGFHQAALQRRVVYYTLLTESHDRMMRFLESMEFYEPSVIPEWLTYVSGFRVLETDGLPGLMRSIRDTISGRKASLLVVDGVVSAQEMAPSELAFKKFLHEIQTLSAMYRCTILLLTSRGEAGELVSEHTMVEGVLKLDSAVVRLKPMRSIEVVKFRGAGQIRGTHTLSISDAGVTVYPRIETILLPGPRPEVDKVGRRRFDSPSLDAMLGGGLLACSNTMVLGPSGVGKSMLSLQFAHAGVTAGEKVLFFTFYEQPRELVSKARRFGFAGVEAACGRGDMWIEWQSSVEASVDKIGCHLLNVFERLRPSRIVIDGIQGFQVTGDPPERIQDFFAALSDFFASRGATMLFTSESEHLVGSSVFRVPFSNASRMCQNILLMRFVEAGGRLAKVLSVVKMRDSDFDPAIRTVVFGTRGLEVEPKE